ncbi:adenosylcobinamide amidohydrolase [Natronoarchaeum sp. GCM10025703]|uniref:adenosylcobinamide amidohydrolase n=1 Tax=unclassified Natronoarchaeum TaxID=2620183 RepID=UPI00361A5338
MAEPRVRDGVLQLSAPGTTWLSTGWNGGRSRADAAYNCTVPEGWERTDLDRYIAERRSGAGFEREGPTLLTGVEMRNARCARMTAERDGTGAIDVFAVATAGVSNPAVLFPGAEPDSDAHRTSDLEDSPSETGTVNLLVHVDQPATEGALANLVAVVAETKTATLLRETGFPGTTTDAVVVGATERSERTPDPLQFTGSGTPTGAAVRACVRDALLAGLAARYADGTMPDTVADAEHGVVADGSPNVFRP